LLYQPRPPQHVQPHKHLQAEEGAAPVPSGDRFHKEAEPALEGGFWSEEMPVRKLVRCSDDGLVAAFFGHEHSTRVAFCEPEAAWSWFLSGHDPWRWYTDIVFFAGKLYALIDDQELLALEVVGHDKEDGQPRISRTERVIHGADCHYELQEYTQMCYLVVRPHGRGLLMVCRIMLEYGSTRYEFAVFRADLRWSRWVQVHTLGFGEALFVGRLCSRAVCAGRHGVPGDHIFFLDDSDGMEGHRHPFGRGDALANTYDMKDGIIKELLPLFRNIRCFSFVKLMYVDIF
jgi:hypothetical protein